MKPLRLDRILNSQGLGSRKEIGSAIRKGRVSVNGVIATKPDVHCCPEEDDIRIDGQSLRYKKHLYVMMNKPAGVLSAARDARQSTVIDLLPPSLRRNALFPAGRLDKDTTGFMLITDDGDFSHRILSPSRHVTKTYHAVLDIPVDGTASKQFEEGIVLDNGLHCLPAKMHSVSPDGLTAEVIITEGKFHQVKQMFQSTGRHVLSLRRIAIGSLALDPALAPGESREITQIELQRILGIDPF